MSDIDTSCQSFIQLILRDLEMVCVSYFKFTGDTKQLISDCGVRSTRTAQVRIEQVEQICSGSLDMTNEVVDVIKIKNACL